MKLKGVNTLQVKLDKIKNASKQKVADLVEVNAKAIADEATANAPNMFKTKNGGFPTKDLKQSIFWESITPLKWKVTVNSVMGAYAEFGTGAYVDVPSGWEEIAWSYYVNGKGMIMPTPYLIPAFRNGKDKFKKDLQKYIDTIDKS